MGSRFAKMIREQRKARKQAMTREGWTIVGTGIALGVLMVMLWGSTNARFDSVDTRLVSIEQRVTRVEVLLENHLQDYDEHLAGLHD